MQYALKGTAALCAFFVLSNAFADQPSELFTYQEGQLTFSGVSLVDPNSNDNIVEVKFQYPTGLGFGLFSLRNPNRFIVNLPHLISKPMLMRAPASGEVTAVRVTNFSGNTRVIFNLANLLPLPSVLVQGEQTLLTLRFKYSTKSAPKAVVEKISVGPVIVPEFHSQINSDLDTTAMMASPDLDAITEAATSNPSGDLETAPRPLLDNPDTLSGEVNPANIGTGTTPESNPLSTDQGILVAPPPAASSPGTNIPVQGPPPGAQADGEISETLFDLYIGDKFSGTVMTRFTENWCEIGEPADAAEQFHEVKT